METAADTARIVNALAERWAAEIGGTGSGGTVLTAVGVWPLLGFLAAGADGAARKELEARLGTTLPEEYRSFLLQVGAGGAGPCRGVYPVHRTGDGWAWSGDGADLADLDRIAEPFPAAGPDPAALAALAAQRPDEESFEDEDEYDTAMEAWDDRVGELLWAADRTVGAIVICHIGCGQREWLIVSGPERGRIWSDNRVDDLDLAPLLDDDGRPVTFARWYLDWLDSTEQQAGQPTG